jgi:predicted nuclease of predicted toxin-antitoxin system
MMNKQCLSITTKVTSGTHISGTAKAVWIRIGNCSTKAVNELLQDRHSEMIAFDGDASASFLILH